MNQSKDLKDLETLAIQTKKSTAIILAMIYMNSIQREVKKNG